MAKLNMTISVSKWQIMKARAYLYLVAFPCAFFEVLFGADPDKVSDKYAKKMVGIINFKVK